MPTRFAAGGDGGDGGGGGVDGGDGGVDEAACERARRFRGVDFFAIVIPRAELGSLSRGRSIDIAGAGLIPARVA